MARSAAVPLCLGLTLLLPERAWAINAPFFSNEGMALFFGLMMFAVIAVFFMNGARAAGAMIMVGVVLFVMFAILEGKVVLAMDGIPLNLAIGVVSSVIGGILLMALGGR